MILQDNSILPGDEPGAKFFGVSTDAFAASMTFRWVLGLPLWIIFSRRYLLRQKLQHVLRLKIESVGLVLVWVMLTILADILVWIIIPYLLGNHPMAFVKESWPWLTLRYIVIYGSVMIGRIPAINYMMRKRM